MKQFTLFGGEVTGVFDPESRFRYKITDPIMGLDNTRIRGVTTVLSDILDKPGLRLWARDEMAGKLFGFSFVESDNGLVPTYNEKKAAIKPRTPYSVDDINLMLRESFDAYKSKTDRGKDIGTMTHDFVAQYLEGGKAPTIEKIMAVYNEAPKEFCDSVLKAVSSFITWWESLEDKEVLGTENVIYSRKYQFSGTYDLKARINGKVYMLDVKTTNRSPFAPLGIYPEYFMQLGGYMVADAEESKTVFDDCGVINVGKDGKLSLATAQDMGLSVEECKGSFIYAIEIHNWLEKLAKLTKDNKLISSLAKEAK